MGVELPRSTHPIEVARSTPAVVWRAMWELVRRRPLVLIVGILLAIDVASALLEVAVEMTDYGFNGAYRLSLETEWGIPQLYGIAKVLVGSALLLAAWRRFRDPVAGYWAAALLYLGADDAWQFHEHLGTFFASRLHLPDVSGLRAQDLGELMAYALIGTTALIALVLAERRTASPSPTRLSAVMVPLVGVLIFFAVIVDVVGGFVMPDVIGVPVEDGGELVALTLILTATWIWAARYEDLAAAAGV